MPFLTNDPLPQCLQPSPLTPLLLDQGHRRGSRRYLSNVKCLHDFRAREVVGRAGLVARAPLLVRPPLLAERRVHLLARHPGLALAVLPALRGAVGPGDTGYAEAERQREVPDRPHHLDPPCRGRTGPPRPHYDARERLWRRRARAGLDACLKIA